MLLFVNIFNINIDKFWCSQDVYYNCNWILTELGTRDVNETRKNWDLAEKSRSRALYFSPIENSENLNRPPCGTVNSSLAIECREVDYHPQSNMVSTHPFLTSLSSVLALKSAH